MADVNNKLRLQIVTQLDAAGIKATKDQIDQLELGVRRAGNSASGSGEKFGKLEKSLGKLPGRLGEIGNKLGGLAGQATMVFGAFSFGVEIGNKICDQLTKWGLMSDPIKELNEENRRYEEECKIIKKALEEVTAEEMKRFDAASQAADRQIKKIDDETAAYLRQAQSLKGLRDAQGNAELMQLERAKFEDMRSYSAAGYGEAAEQIGKYYDVLIEELKAKQQIAAFDRESVKVNQELAKHEEAYARAAARVSEAKENQQRAEAALESHRRKNSITYRNGGGVWFNNENDANKDDELEKVAKRAAADAEKAAEVMRKRGERLETVEAGSLQRQMERANLAAAGSMSVDRAAAAYDSYVMQTGNPIGASIDQGWAAEILKNSAESDQTQKDILEQVRNFADRLEMLLEMK